MIYVLDVVVGIVTVVCAVYLWRWFREPKEERDWDNGYRAKRIQLLEHWNMIAGHEKTCPDCIDQQERRDYWREVDIARSHSYEAYEKVDVAKALEGLRAARGNDDEPFDMVEVSVFGDARPYYIRGMRK